MSIAVDPYRWLPLPTVAVLSAVGAVTSRCVGSREDAWTVLPVALAWGLVAALAGFRLPRVRWWWVFLAALLVRLPWVGSPPHLSDDLYRYLWEGRVLAAGHDPFSEAPSSLAGLDDGLRALVNHPDLTSVYPPLALWWFRLLAVVGTPAWAQGWTALVDAGTAAIVTHAGRRPSAGWVYALHPLPVLESACGAHVDVPAVALAALAVLAWRRGAADGAVWWAMAGVATKLFPVVLLPALLRDRPLRRSLHLVLAGTAAVLLALPLVHLGPGLWSSARLYAQTWSFLGFAFRWTEPWLGSATRPALVVVGAVIVGIAAWRRPDPAEVWSAAGTAFVFLSPTVHPWYVLWALVPSLLLGRVDWALGSLGSLLAYAVLASFDPTTGAWTEAPWLWWLVWSTVVAGLAVGRALQRRSEDEPTIV